MKKRYIALIALGTTLLSSSAFAGHFQDTLDDIDEQLQEINQRERDREFSEMVSTMSSEEILAMVRNIYRSTSDRWARQFLIQYGTASDRASLEQEQRLIEQQKVNEEYQRRIEQQKANEQYRRWIEQQKANLRSPNPMVRKQARENLLSRGIQLN
jgi:hypothetical protein